MRCTNLIPLIVLSLNSICAPMAQTNSRTEDSSVVKFDWNCSSPMSYPKKTLNKIVRSTMNQQKFSGFGTSGDRAVALDLDGNHKNEYFVPLDCGATGNCVWGLFALSPPRRLAIIRGQDIYVQTRRGHWPKLVVYSHLSAVEGLLTTYEMRRGSYFEISPGLPINHGEFDLDIQGGAGNKMPKVLEGAKPVCNSFGT